MTRKYFYLIGTFIFFYCVLSCNKPGNSGIEDKIIGKWYVDSIQARQSNNNNNVVTYVTVYIYTAKIDYWDYRTDDKLYRYTRGLYDTIPYTLGKNSNGHYIQYSQNSADSIKTLTNHLLVMIDPQGSSTKLFLSK